MSKIYYKVEVRIYEVINKISDWRKGQLKSVSDGFGKVENDVFDGYATNDKLSGDISSEEIWLEILTDDNEYLSFSATTDSIELPGKYVLYSKIQNDYICELYFMEKVTDYSEIQKIDSEIQRVNVYHTLS